MNKRPQPERVRASKNPKRETPKLLGLISGVHDDSVNARGFKATQNPIFVWQEWKRRRSQNITSLPTWVLRYLDKCASELLNLVEHPPTTALDGAIAQAMQFKQGGRVNDLGESYRTYQQTIMLAAMVRHLVEDRGYSMTKAYEEVARNRGVSKVTVQRAWLTEPE